MVYMTSNADIPRTYFGDILQLTNWILDSGANFHMTTDNSDFIPGLFVETDKLIKYADGDFFTEKQTG